MRLETTLSASALVPQTHASFLLALHMSMFMGVITNHRGGRCLGKRAR